MLVKLIKHIVDVNEGTEKSFYTLDCSSNTKNVRRCSKLMKIALYDKTGVETKNYLQEQQLKSDDIDYQNELGWTALMIASRNSNKTSSLATVKVLIDAGSNIDLQNTVGWTALMLASICTGSSDTVKTLIDAGANIDLQSLHGETALMRATHCACICNNSPSVETLKILIDSGANLDLQDSKGHTALMVATSINNSINIVEMLLEAGADQTLQDNEGYTALVYALKFVTNYSDANKILTLFETYKQKEIRYISLTEECSICTEKMVNPCAINCGHVYCYRCLNTIINADCPMCRTPIKSKTRLFI